MQRQLVGELVDLALAPGELPVLRDEQVTQGIGVEFVEVGGQRHAQIMPLEHRHCHRGIPRW